VPLFQQSTCSWSSKVLPIFELVGIDIGTQQGHCVYMTAHDAHMGVHGGLLIVEQRSPVASWVLEQ
jgi:hypothetical protein